MPLTALGLILIAAFTHASWNLMAKRAADCRHFVWMYSVGTMVLWSPLIVGLFWFAPPHLDSLIGGALLVSAILHTLYSQALQRGYQVGDLSVVYPLARGSGPLLSFIGAVLVLGERPTLLAALGALLVVLGVLFLAGGPRLLRAAQQRTSLLWGIGIGGLISLYTVWDAWAVKVLLLSPILVDYAGNILRALMLSPRVWPDRAHLAGNFKRYWREVMAVALLGPLGYTLVLFAVQQAPLSHVAPARELSMLVGAWFGARLLKEGELPRRMFAAAIIGSGVLCLAVG